MRRPRLAPCWLLSRKNRLGRNSCRTQTLRDKSRCDRRFGCSAGSLFRNQNQKEERKLLDSCRSPVSCSPVSDFYNKDAGRLQLLYLSSAAQPPPHWRILSPSHCANPPIRWSSPTVATPPTVPGSPWRRNEEGCCEAALYNPRPLKQLETKKSPAGIDRQKQQQGFYLLTLIYCPRKSQ